MADANSRRANAGVFDSLFSVLTRPARSISSAAYNTVDDDEETSALQGFINGLTGKQTNTWSDVLATQGVDGPLGAVLGFAGDVGLDPMTYVGIKGAKGTTAGLAKMKSMQEFSDLGKDVVMDEADRLMQENPTRLWVSFAGRKISPDLKLKSDGAIQQFSDKLMGPEGDKRWLSRAFSNKGEKGFGMANMERVHVGGSAAQFANHQNAIRNLLTENLNEDELIAVTRAIDNKEELSGVPLQLANGNKSTFGRSGAKHPEGFSTLQHYKALVQSQHKDLWDLEKDMGLVDDSMYNDHYVKHYFRNTKKMDKDFMFEVPTVGGANTASFMKKRKSKDISLDEAKAADLDPEMRIDKLLELRAAEHYRVMGRAKMVRDAGTEFGVKLGPKNQKLIKEEGYRSLSDLGGPVGKTMADTYVPREIFNVLDKTEKVLTDGSEGTQFMKFMDKVMGEWKFLNTAVNPGYHIRNTFTDGLMNAADGVMNPKWYTQARRVLADKKVHTSNSMLKTIGAEMEPGFVSKLNIAGHQVDAERVWRTYVRSGAKSGFISADLRTNSNGPEALEALSNLYDKGKAGYRSGKGRINDIADTREDYFRLAHFIKVMEDELPKGKGKLSDAAWETAAAKASERVRKYNIDYGNLSSFEKKTVSKFIPFYSFMRQNAPLQMQMLFTKPGFMALYPKGQDMLQGVFGTEDENGEQFIPEWIRNTAPVRLALSENSKNTVLGKVIKRLSGAKEGEPVYLPSVGGLTPLQDLLNLANPVNEGAKALREGEGISGAIGAGASEVSRTLAGMSHPGLRTAYEAGTGKNINTRADFTWKDWLTGQLGPVRTGSQIAQQGGLGTALTRTVAGVPLQVGSYDRQEAMLEQQLRQLSADTSKERQATPQYQAILESLKAAGLSDREISDRMSGYTSKIQTRGTVANAQQKRLLEQLFAQQFA